jgi:cobalt-zinc-cadmium efflux system outer membrane protein
MGNISRGLVALVVLELAAVRLMAAQEMPNMPDLPAADAQHQHMDMQGVQMTLPRMGRAQERAAERLFTLEEAQRLAIESNPTLRQAEAEIRAANARQQQVGLYPNPTLGYIGDEIRGGSVGGGKQGFFVRQLIVTGGKLGDKRTVLSKESQIAAIEVEEQKIRVQTAIKTAYLRVLAAQELLDVRRDLAKIEQDYTETQRQLANSGQADETEVLQAEISARRQRLASHMQENALREEWHMLTALIGRPEAPMMVVSGQLEGGWPEIDEAQIAQRLAAESPATRIAGATAAKADAEIIRAKHEAIPDVELRGGLLYNNELLGSAPYAKGWEGIAEVGVQLPIFNRNQGAIAAAQAESERAKLEMQRVALTIRQRATSILDEYANARLMATEYHEELLPRAQKAYVLMNEKYGQMLASYPRVIEMRRKLYELQEEYIRALESVWITAVALDGYLLTDGLEAPSRPGEVDHPVRELNVPLAEAPGAGFGPPGTIHP